MSSQKGNVGRTRSQKHRNAVAFKNDLHDKTKKTKLMNSLEVAGVCPRCKDIIEWKIKYKKYKPLTVPKKCTKCEGKSVNLAYHMVCQPCAEECGICAKCGKTDSEVSEIKPSADELAKNKSKFDKEIKALPERKRRALLRYMSKGEVSVKAVEEKLAGLKEDLLDDFDDLSIDSSFDSQEEDISDTNS